MNNIELRLAAEQKWREENLLKELNKNAKKQKKYIWDALNPFTLMVAMDFLANKKMW